MYKIGLLMAIVFMLSACAHTKKSEESVALNPEEISQSWQMDGRSPEWSGRINGRRYEASFPGLYENKMVSWDVSQTDKTTYLNSKTGGLNIAFTEQSCNVANATYTHTVTVKNDGKVFTGCARH